MASESWQVYRKKGGWTYRRLLVKRKFESHKVFDTRDEAYSAAKKEAGTGQVKG